MIEEGHLHRPGGILDVDHNHRTTLASAAAAHLGHPTEDHRLVAHHEVGEVSLAGAVDVPPGIGPQQVENRLDAERRQCRHALWANALEDADLDGGELGECSPVVGLRGRGGLGVAHSIPKRYG